jgi:ComF family protein
MERGLSIWSNLLPQDCLLCGGLADGLLCAPCRDCLPAMADACCPTCAERSPAANPCGACSKLPPHFDATIAGCAYAFPTDKLIQALKYRHRLAVADLLAEVMLAGRRPVGDLIVPVPLAAARLRGRGFNQSLEIARPLAKVLGLPLQMTGCTRRLDTVAQATLPWTARRKNIRHAFECTLDLTGCSVIVVDDVMTTGATLGEFALTLKNHGAVLVTNWVAARALRS